MSWDHYDEMFVDRNGSFITPDEQSRLRQQDDYKIIRQTTIDEYFISTVWTGDYAGGLMEPFETMVWASEHSDELIRQKHATEPAALQSHIEIVEGIRGLLSQGIDFAGMVLYVRGERAELPDIPGT